MMSNWPVTFVWPQLLWLLLAPRVWLHMSQGLRDRLRYLGPTMSKKLPFAPFVLVGVLASIHWIH